MHILSRWLALFLLTALAPLPAHAQLVSQAMYVTIKGAMTTDTYGIFGTPNTNLAGSTATIYQQYYASDYLEVAPAARTASRFSPTRPVSFYPVRRSRLFRLG